MFETQNLGKEPKMSSFSPTILAEAKALAREFLDHPEVTELRLPVGSGGGGLVLTVIEQGHNELERFELGGRTFYIALPDSATDDQAA